MEKACTWILRWTGYANKMSTGMYLSTRYDFNRLKGDRILDSPTLFINRETSWDTDNGFIKF